MAAILGALGIIALVVFIFQAFEIIYMRNYKKPFIVFVPIFINKLSEEKRGLIANHFSFYSNLKPKYKRYFEHRVNRFKNHYNFVGKEVEVTEEMKILIASVYVKLTFGFRDYLSKSFATIIIYPQEYYSVQNDQYHKGEFNPRIDAVVFSWKHFHEGIRLPNDNLNLGLHEFTHVLHIESKSKNNLKSILFKENLQNLFMLLDNVEIKNKLIESGFLRDYAYENQFEFVAVLLEHFFESPQEFKTKFPEIYSKVKQMINFNEQRFIVLN